MSVINQMLKDLEENKQNTVQVTPVASIAPSRSSKLVMVLLMLLITGLAAVSVYLFAEKLQRQDTASVVSAEVPVITPQENGTVTVQSAEQQELLQEPLAADKVTDLSPLESQNTVVSAEVPASAVISAPAYETTETTASLAKTSASAGVSVQEPVIPVTKVAEAKAPAVQAPVAKKPAALEPVVTAPAADVSVAADDSFAIKPVQRSPKEQAARYFKQVNDALLIGDTLKAKKQLVKILRLDKHHDQAREKLASLLYGEQRFTDAVKLLQQGLSVSPQYPNFRLMLARIYLQNNDKQQAYYYLKPLKPDVRENLDYYAMLAGLAQSLGDLEQAKAAYLQLTKHDANRAKWWLGLGISADKLQQQTLALSAYKQAQSMGQLSPASRRYINDRINQLEKY